MPIIDEKTLYNQIQNREFLPAYFLFGTESFSVLRYKKRLVDALVSNMEDMNLSTFDGTKADVNDVVEACNQLPVFNDYRCIVVNDMFQNGGTGEEVEILSSYLESPNISTVLIFVYSGELPKASKGTTAKDMVENSSETEKPKKQKNTFLLLQKAVEKSGGVCEFGQMDDAQLIKYISQFAGKRNCTIQVAAARYLVFRCNNDFLWVNNEMEKLCAFKGGQELTEKDIDLLCPKTLETNVFNLTDSIAKNNKDAALKMLDDLLIQKEEPEKIFGALCLAYINMYRCFAASTSGRTPDSFGNELKVKGLYRQNGLARRLGEEKITLCLDVLSRCDREIKRTYDEPKILLEKTIVNLCAICGK